MQEWKPFGGLDRLLGRFPTAALFLYCSAMPSESNPSDAPELDYTPEGIPVPRFTPWRGRNHKPNGWSAATQRAFIYALVRCGSARTAARAVGKSVRSAYLLRDKPGAASFACAWDQAMLLGRQCAVDAAIDRGLHGNDRMLLGALNAIGKNVREKRWVDYAEIWNRLLDWENELNRRQLDIEDPGPVLRAAAEAEAAHEHRIWQKEIARQKRLARAREIRAALRRADDRDAARDAGPRIHWL